MLRALEQSLAAIQQEAAVPAESSADFQAEQFWPALGAAADRLAFEANKLSLAWVQPPPPPTADLLAMGAGLEAAAVALLAHLHTFPRALGSLVSSGLAAVATAALVAARELVQGMADTVGAKFAANSHPVLQAFARVTERCEAVKTVHRTNRAAALAALGEQLGLLKDAVGELEEARADGFMEAFGEEEGVEEQWGEEDKLIINPCMGLMKTSVVTVKKVMGSVRAAGREEGEGVGELDGVVEGARRLSPLVDDLALSLYPPLACAEAKGAADRLVMELQATLAALPALHFMAGPEAAWLDFVARAVVHNMAELQRVLVTRGLGQIRLGGGEGEGDGGS